jgi:hypothetical protein
MGGAFLVNIMKIEFKEDFATSKKGDIVDVNSIIASNLIRRGVAKSFVAKRRRVKSENKNGKPKTEDK